jgi:hypothetical protein
MSEPEVQTPPPKKGGCLKKVLLVLVLAVAALCVAITLQPAEFRFERSATISAPPATVFAQVNDFHKWRDWSPWEELDPNLQRTYAGEPAGTGAIYSWVGNSEVGEGKMTITESRPNEFIRIKLEFIKPFAATSTSEFSFKPDGDKTNVTWTMTGQNNFIGKAFHLFMNMDKEIGAQFDKGLAKLKTVAESAAAK